MTTSRRLCWLTSIEGSHNDIRARGDISLDDAINLAIHPGHAPSLVRVGFTPSADDLPHWKSRSSWPRASDIRRMKFVSSSGHESNPNGGLLVHFFQSRASRASASPFAPRLQTMIPSPTFGRLNTMDPPTSSTPDHLPGRPEHLRGHRICAWHLFDSLGHTACSGYHVDAVRPPR